MATSAFNAVRAEKFWQLSNNIAVPDDEILNKKEKNSLSLYRCGLGMQL